MSAVGQGHAHMGGRTATTRSAAGRRYAHASSTRTGFTTPYLGLAGWLAGWLAACQLASSDTTSGCGGSCRSSGGGGGGGGGGGSGSLTQKSVCSAERPGRATGPER